MFDEIAGEKKVCIFSPAFSSNIHRYFNNTFHEFKLLKKVTVTAATGAKNHRHESRTDEDVYLYLHTCSA